MEISKDSGAFYWHNNDRIYHYLSTLSWSVFLKTSCHMHLYCCKPKPLQTKSVTRCPTEGKRQQTRTLDSSFVFFFASPRICYICCMTTFFFKPNYPYFLSRLHPGLWFTLPFLCTLCSCIPGNRWYHLDQSWEQGLQQGGEYFRVYVSRRKAEKGRGGGRMDR